MLFEEFFKKKRIDLEALQKAEAGLFAEFKTHYAEMGEKSFDHTKKYWFNKIRREFPLAVEVKTEKPKIANPLAEQTITESLEEMLTPKPGFVPRFKTANIVKPDAETSPENKAEEIPAVPAPPKPGFTPRFKATNMPKPVGEQSAEEPKTDEPAPAPPTPKPGFTPRFKAANMPKPVAPPEEQAPEKIDASESAPSTSPENAEFKPAYKPRFNPKNIPKKEE